MSDELAHYTTEQGLAAILSTKKLWATHWQFLNDSSELQHGMHIINCIFDDVRKSMPKEDLLRRFIEQEEPKFLQNLWFSGIAPNQNVPEFFITSFSRISDENKDDGILSQWRSYGDFSIVFSRDSLRKSYRFFSKKCKEHVGLDLQEGCLECKKFIFAHTLDLVRYPQDIAELEKEGYKDSLEVIKKYAPIFINGVKEGALNITLNEFDLFVKAITVLLTTIKHPGFNEEKEFRFACLNRVERYGGGYDFESPYEVAIKNNAPRLEVDFSPEAIKRIIIGPQPNQDQKVVIVRHYLDLYGYKSVDVVKSSIPYKKNISAEMNH